LEEKVESLVKVKNKLGLHVRPATQITLTYKRQSVNARSIMSIMILAAPKNAQLKIEAQGMDAKETLEELLNAFNKKFGEDG
jgi:phosphocarrier protein HPr